MVAWTQTHYLCKSSVPLMALSNDFFGSICPSDALPDVIPLLSINTNSLPEGKGGSGYLYLCVCVYVWLVFCAAALSEG